MPMVATPTLDKVGFCAKRQGSASSLALAIGSNEGASRSGFYGSLTPGSEKLGVVVNGVEATQLTTTGLTTTNLVVSASITLLAASLSLAALAVVAAGTLLGNVTAGAASPTAITGAQATSLINPFTDLLKGLAPASGGGTTNFLRADGTWAAAGGSGTVTGSGAANQIAIWSSASAVSGDTGLTAAALNGLFSVGHNAGTSSYQFGVHGIVTTTTLSGATFGGIVNSALNVNMNANPTVAGAQGIYAGIYSDLRAQPSAATHLTGTLTGVRSRIDSSSSSPGAHARYRNYTSLMNIETAGTATISDISEFYAEGTVIANNSGMLTITNLYGMYLPQPTITFSYVTVTNRYGVYSGDKLATNFFAGTITLAGSTSGSSGFRVAAVAGTPEMLQLPTVNGSSGNVLSTDGAGVLSWSAAGGGGTIGGSIAADQVAVGSGVDAVAGSAALTFSMANGLDVTMGATVNTSPISATGSYNSHLQIHIQNASSGLSASSDIVATADTGSDTTNYVDFGINSSTYNGGIFGAALDGYLYCQDQALHIGTATAGKAINFLAGGSSVSTNTVLSLAALTSTFSNKIVAFAASASAASLNIPTGVTPSAPNGGDLWETTIGVFARVGSTTRSLLNNQLTVAATAGNQTLTSDTEYARYTGSGGHTWTLPSASASTTHAVAVLIKNRGTGTLLLAPAGADTIEGGPVPIPILPGQARYLITDMSSDWSVT